MSRSSRKMTAEELFDRQLMQFSDADVEKMEVLFKAFGSRPWSSSEGAEACSCSVEEVDALIEKLLKLRVPQSLMHPAGPISARGVKPRRSRQDRP